MDRIAKAKSKPWSKLNLENQIVALVFFIGFYWYSSIFMS